MVRGGGFCPGLRVLPGSCEPLVFLQMSSATETNDRDENFLPANLLPETGSPGKPNTEVEDAGPLATDAVLGRAELLARRPNRRRPYHVPFPPSSACKAGEACVCRCYV